MRSQPGHQAGSLEHQAAVRAGIDPVKADVAACGKGARGRVKLSIKVSPAGKVTSVSVVEAPDGDVGACAAKAVSTATFARTRSGGSFVFPFLL